MQFRNRHYKCKNTIVLQIKTRNDDALVCRQKGGFHFIFPNFATLSLYISLLERDREFIYLKASSVGIALYKFDCLFYWNRRARGGDLSAAGDGSTPPWTIAFQCFYNKYI